MSLTLKLEIALAGFILSLGVLGGAGWYFHHKWYNEGVTDTTAKIAKEQHAIELKTEAAAKAADDKYAAEVVARQAAEAKLGDSSARVADLVRKLAVSTKAARIARQPDDTGADWIGVLGECTSKYEQVGRDAARLSDKVNGLQAQLLARQFIP